MKNRPLTLGVSDTNNNNNSSNNNQKDDNLRTDGIESVDKMFKGGQEYLWLLKQLHSWIGVIILILFLIEDIPGFNNIYLTLNYNERSMFLQNINLLWEIIIVFILCILNPILYLWLFKPLLIKKNDTQKNSVCIVLSPGQAVLTNNLNALKFMEAMGVELTQRNYPMVCIVLFVCVFCG